jgi:hypothetical protein
MISLHKKTLCLSLNHLSDSINMNTNSKHCGELFLVSKAHEQEKYCKSINFKCFKYCSVAIAVSLNISRSKLYRDNIRLAYAQGQLAKAEVHLKCCGHY